MKPIPKSFDNDARAAITGPDGRFVFTAVPPVPLSLRVVLGPWQDESFRSGPHVPLDLQPDQQVELDLGGAGAVVTGKVEQVLGVACGGCSPHLKKH